MDRLIAKNFLTGRMCRVVLFVQKFLKKTAHYLPTYHSSQMLVDQARNTPYNMWLETCTNWFNSAEMQILFSMKFGFLVVSVHNYMIPHQYTERRFLTDHVIVK